ncbi:TIGR03620 family F420-dependent LLM class oxidoreductase [Thermoactinospora rubra]|uniref:TIGR03620 family F420-dependent LLM class oxidoreductase n=1 Tax=Thermoactinospora rubra TaxID=1088767 RepID=UPI000A10F983|nr:TIGR03620 family F420-dependent LLM class oxidoreductase [Thermoactinospora rubra]
MDGRIGVWHPVLGRGAAEASRRAAAEIERLGYGTVWVNEGPGSREPLTAAAILLAATRRIGVGVGIASIWSRDATATAAAQAALGEAFPGRFILGLGVSHQVLVDARGHDYGRPLSAMRAYLEAMDQVKTDVPEPAYPAPRLLAALRPKMLELARDRADGAFPYFVPPEHTSSARQVLGGEKLLVVEQAVVVERDPDRARRVAREHTSRYLTLPNYLNNLRALGFGDADFAGGGSDRLVDAIVAWGEEETIAKRVRAHLDAGADHVAVQPLASAHEEVLGQVRALAGPLLSS